jgi:hypothetical protein
MQTGQNCIAPENSLPQLGQVRWGSGFMDLTVLQPQHTRTAWFEIGQDSGWHTVVPLHAQLRVPLFYRVKSLFGTEFVPLAYDYLSIRYERSWKDRPRIGSMI